MPTGVAGVQGTAPPSSANKRPRARVTPGHNAAAVAAATARAVRWAKSHSARAQHASSVRVVAALG
eukprot:800132-Prymnesium_polylepis.1